MHFYPAIDLQEGKCIRLKKGILTELTVYNDNPVKQAEKFYESGASWIHIVDIDGGSLQYTHYNEGQFYNWHQDSDLDTHHKPQMNFSSGENRAQEEITQAGEYIRKLSFTLQLSEPTDYRGGEVEFLDNGSRRFLAPKQRGTMIVFDSRVRHRVRKIKSGTRKSIVGWVVGPRWK